MSHEPIRVWARVHNPPLPVPAGGILSPSTSRGNAPAATPSKVKSVPPQPAPPAAASPAPAAFSPVGKALAFSSLSVDEASASLLFSDAAGNSVPFPLDGVLPPGAPQAAAFAALGAPAAAHLAAGFNACVLAYGRSGTGKTHTILGPAAPLPAAGAWDALLRSGGEGAGGAGAQLGLVPRALCALLRRAEEEDGRDLEEEAEEEEEEEEAGAGEGSGGGSGGDDDDDVWGGAAGASPPPPRRRRRRRSSRGPPPLAFAVAEVYNNKLADLLAEGEPAPPGGDHLTPSLSRLAGWHPVRGGGSARALLARAAAARARAATALNADSSRSHVLYLLRWRGGPILCVADLAGSETLDVSPAAAPAAAAARGAETRAINTSLHVLTRVVAAHAAAAAARGGGGGGGGSAHVPFRESLLTLLLRDCIGGNAKTVRAGVCALCSPRCPLFFLLTPPPFPPLPSPHNRPWWSP
jgi:hypothetical protein